MAKKEFEDFVENEEGFSLDNESEVEALASEDDLEGEPETEAESGPSSPGVVYKRLSSGRLVPE